MELKHFNIRVYGIILNDVADAVLISDEFMIGMRMTKFPGGGMNLGEGTIDCLKREAIEEFGQEVHILRHFYTTDFFQQALFYPDRQLISIYYLSSFIEQPKFNISEIPFDYEEEKEGCQSFRWVKIKELNPEMFTFPIDKHVAGLISRELGDGK